MGKVALLFVLISIFSLLSYGSTFQVENYHKMILGEWEWEKSVGGIDDKDLSSPKIIGYRRKIAFTEDGRVVTYKNNIELRINKYTIDKGINIFDNCEDDLLTFEGRSYIIESLSKNCLIIKSNSVNGYRSIFKK